MLGEINLGEKTKMSTVGLAINIASRIQKYTKKLNNDLLVSNQTIKESSIKVNVKPTEVKLEGVTAQILVYPLGKPYTK